MAAKVEPFRRRSFSLPQIKLLNWLVPVIPALDPILPIPPLSLIAILRPAAGKSAAPETTSDADSVGHPVPAPVEPAESD